MRRDRLPICAAVALSAAAARSARAEDALGMATPTAPAPREVGEVGAGPTYYRLAPDLVNGLARTGLGAQVRLSGGDTAFTFDELGGVDVRLGRTSDLDLWIEGGYSFAHGHSHLAVLGAGLARPAPGMFGTVFALVPHAVIGEVDGALGVGVRTSAIAGCRLYALELAHQVTFGGGGHVQELHVLVTFPFSGGRM